MPTVEKNEVTAIGKKLGNKCTAFATTIAKLYMCAPGATEWRDTGIWGAISCVLDRSHANKPWFIKLFDTQNGMEIKFSMEIYEHMPYDAPNPLFHTFEVKNAIVGVCFCDQTEATTFLSAYHHITPHHLTSHHTPFHTTHHRITSHSATLCLPVDRVFVCYR